MKQLLTILIVLLIGSQQTYAQGSEKLDAFRAKVLPEYSMFFNQAELTENRQLKLTAIDKYSRLSAEEKKAIMGKISTAWRESLILVHNVSKRELWGWNAETGSTQLLDEWDMNSQQLAKIPQLVSRPHPWFLYIGGQLGGDNQQNVNLSFNTRIGFFLLKNRWDFAATLSTGVTENSNYEESSTSFTNLGLMSRVHFPLKKYKISPNIGLEISSASFGDTPSNTSLSLMLGVRWFVGVGCVDVGFRIGNEFTTMGGYTFSPRFNSH